MGVVKPTQPEYRPARVRLFVNPIVFDLFCGLGGWSEAFIAEGYRAVGFDIEAHDYGNGGYPGELVLMDIRSLNGAELVKEFGMPVCIVASPPCQEFSYMAMPWSKAKEKMRKIQADPAEQKSLTDLFNQCFRIQREVSATAGHYVPMVVENVRGAQRWVGKARWNFGSFYLWGDVPALMPIPMRGKNKTCCPPIPLGKMFHETGRSISAITTGHIEGRKGEGNKTVGMNWSDRSKTGQDFTRIAGQQAVQGTKLPGNNSPRLRKDRDVQRLADKGVKKRDDDGYDLPGRTFGWKAPRTQSKSNRRKQASAEIAKIPASLAQ